MQRYLRSTHIKISVVNPLEIDDGLSSLGMVGRQNTSAIIWFTDMINLSKGLILELASYYVRSSSVLLTNIKISHNATGDN